MPEDKNPRALTNGKAENADVQRVQTDGNGSGNESPNSKRRSKGRPTLHIKIPFFKRTASKSTPPVNACSDSPLDAGDISPIVCQSLPSESHMPSSSRDIGHVLCLSPDDGSPDRPAEDGHTSADSGDNSSDDSVQVARTKKTEEEMESEKHQSDFEENEKSSAPKSAKSDRAQGDQPSEGSVEPGAVTAKACLKSCLKNRYGRRRRASTFPPLDCSELSEEAFRRCVKVTFSPDTVDPPPRNCKYREWIERKCNHGRSQPINIKHEKRKCQLNQMRKVNISDYMSKNYGSSFFSPVGSFGGDMLL
ncbi:uncharacterized protein [Diadema setosum]|uniref:uncharacterized protein n=1 Tax=Diadema setosum TaxID=31175 RepID=UPI003B3A3C7A